MPRGGTQAGGEEMRPRVEGLKVWCRPAVGCVPQERFLLRQVRPGSPWAACVVASSNPLLPPSTQCLFPGGLVPSSCQLKDFLSHGSPSNKISTRLHAAAYPRGCFMSARITVSCGTCSRASSKLTSHPDPYMVWPVTLPAPSSEWGFLA